MQMYTDRQMALQAAVEFAKESSHVNNSFDVLAVAERFRKFLEEGVVETRTQPNPTAVAHYTGGHKPRVGNG